MAILFSDGFDSNLPYYSSKYDNYDGTIGTLFSPGRTGNGARWNSGFATKNLISNESTIVAGFALRFFASADTGVCLKFIDNATTQIYLNINSSSQIEVKHGNGTILGTSTSLISDTTWTYIEFKAVINNSTGSFDLRINGVSEVSDTNIDTQNSSNSYVDKVALGKDAGSFSFEFDDYYINNSEFLSTIKVYTIVPTSDSSVAWTPSAGSNYECVDDAGQGHDSDTSYITATTTNIKDLYGLSDLALTSGVIKGIAHNFTARKTDLNPTNIEPIIEVNGSEYTSTSQSMTTSYLNYQTIWENNPDTASAWTYSDIDSLIAGIQTV